MIDNILASLMMFTRLPWWRIRTVNKDCFTRAVDYWPLAGWITGGALVLSFVVCSMVFPPTIALILAIATRLLVTGALHEDGLADFADGMGGGHTRDRILSIMKDSHIGTFGVLALIVYYLLLYTTLTTIHTAFVCDIFIRHYRLLFCAILLTADVWGKSVASLLVRQLPYARREEDAKTKVVYRRINLPLHILRILIAMTPCVALMIAAGPADVCNLILLALVVPLVVEVCLMMWMRKTLQGYTGDCCGATFLLCELSFLVVMAATA